jgi:hypothetical protein
MSLAKPRQFYIQGVTKQGRTFRPSDWAERLAGAMSSLPPGGGAGGIGAYIGYSPYCVPRVIDGVKCVIVNEALQGHRADGLGLRDELRPRQRPAVTEAPSGARNRANRRGMKKGPAAAGPFRCTCSAGSGRQRQGLDLGGQAALQAGGLVLVEDALVGHRVDHALGGLEQSAPWPCRHRPRPSARSSRRCGSASAARCWRR